MRSLFATALGTALAGCLALVLLLPPRGAIADPEYYANGPDIPVALRAVEQAQGSARVITEELNEQLVGLARLVAASSQREPGRDLNHLVRASDLHNNLLALPALDRAVGQKPLFFAGDLTSSGSPLRGLRVAGYADPFERRARDHSRQLREPRPTPEEQEQFRDWLRPLLGRVDVVMVHSPALAETAADELRRIPPRLPLALLTGHTHTQSFHSSTNVLELNGGDRGRWRNRQPGEKPAVRPRRAHLRA